MNNFLALSLILQINLARITNNDPECEIFKSKIRTANANAKINNSTRLSFGGAANFQLGTANLVIQLHYNDDQYFYDRKYQGLTKEDGIDNELTCLDLKLLKFPDNQFNVDTQEEVTDLFPVASSNETIKWRYLTYIIPGDQLVSRLVTSGGKGYFTFTGYYAIAYYIDNDVQFIYNFSFSVVGNKKSITADDAQFFQISNTETLRCKSEKLCSVTPSSSIEFCTDSTCLKTTPNPTIYLDDWFWIIQKVTTPGFRQYYLSDTKIRFINENLNMSAKIEAENYTVAGQAIYGIIAPLALDQVIVIVNNSLIITISSNEQSAQVESTISINGQCQTQFQQKLPPIPDKPDEETNQTNVEETSHTYPDGEIKITVQCSQAKMFFFIGLAFLSFVF